MCEDVDGLLPGTAVSGMVLFVNVELVAAAVALLALSEEQTV
jgi:hypothetical protein